MYVRLNPNDRFFEQWLKDVSELSEAEIAGMERVKRNYEYLSQEEPSLEEVIKLVVASPLLDFAGFYLSRNLLDWM